MRRWNFLNRHGPAGRPFFWPIWWQPSNRHDARPPGASKPHDATALTGWSHVSGCWHERLVAGKHGTQQVWSFPCSTPYFSGEERDKGDFFCLSHLNPTSCFVTLIHHQFVPSPAVWAAGESRAVWRHDDERGHAIQRSIKPYGPDGWTDGNEPNGYGAHAYGTWSGMCKGWDSLNTKGKKNKLKISVQTKVFFFFPSSINFICLMYIHYCMLGLQHIPEKLVWVLFRTQIKGFSPQSWQQNKA